MKISNYKTEFVDRTPEHMEDGVVYVMPHKGVAIHKCMCGCGRTVEDHIIGNHRTWEFDGTNFSLMRPIWHPDIPCRSRYFLISGSVVWP